MKKLDIFIIKSFIGPFLITFSIAMFFLIMQFLWVYIDDLIGKGLEIWILFKLLFFVSATLIPLALPLAVLFSSIMTYGNLAERNELTALKASGQSLLKVMRPMLYFVIFLSVGAFYFTNYLLPIANYKWRAIYYDIAEQKPTFGITPGVFYNDIEGYSIRVDAKNDNTGELEGVLIYELGNKGNAKTIKARKGEMLRSESNQFLLLKLEGGAMYEKIKANQFKSDNYPFQKTFFDEAIIKFNLSGFNIEESDDEMFKREHEMMNFVQLQDALDSMEVKFAEDEKKFVSSLKNQMVTFNPNFNLDSVMDSTAQNYVPDIQPIDTIIIFDSIHSSEYSAALAAAQTDIRSTKDIIFGQTQIKTSREVEKDEYRTVWHQKFTLSIAVLVLFFIGAPLGAIIKKGGLGAPLVFATLFFLLYYVLTIMGENMVMSGFITPWKGMWLSTFCLTPLGIFLTYKAANDSALFDWDAYKKVFNRIFKRSNA